MLQRTEKYTAQPTPATPRRVTGQYVARAHLTRRQRARLAADLANGTALIWPLTIKQAASLARVPALDVAKYRHNGNGKRVLYRREVGDSDIDAVIAKLGPEKVMAALDRYTAPRFAFAAE
jgi:hypothetical protein